MDELHGGSRQELFDFRFDTLDNAIIMDLCRCLCIHRYRYICLCIQREREGERGNLDPVSFVDRFAGFS